MPYTAFASLFSPIEDGTYDFSGLSANALFNHALNLVNRLRHSLLEEVRPCDLAIVMAPYERYRSNSVWDVQVTVPTGGEGGPVSVFSRKKIIATNPDFGDDIRLGYRCNKEADKARYTLPIDES